MPNQTVYFNETEVEAIEQADNSFSGAVRDAVKDYYGLEEA